MTLAEVVVALLLLSLLIVSVLAVFTSFLSSSVKANDQAIGVFFAEEILDRVTAQASSAYPAFSPTQLGAQGFYTQDPTNQTQYFYSVTATDLDPVRNANPSGPGQSWLLETDVRWWNPAAGGTRTGYGNLHVHHGRMVYISR